MYATSAIPAHDYQRPTWGNEGRRRMAEDRAGYTTDNPADAATQTEPAQNISAFPPRTWTQVDNSYYDRVWGKVSMTAWGVLSYFHRYALGYHRADVRVSIHELATRAGLAIHTTKKALRELEDAGLITTNADGCGRTQTRTFILLPETSWLLPEHQQSETRAIFALDDNLDDTDATRAKIALAGSATRAKINLVDGQTRAKIAPHIKKEEKKEQKKEKASAVVSEVAASDLSVAATRDAALSVSSSPTEPTPTSAPSKPSAPPQNKVAPRRTLADDSQAVLLAMALRDAILAHKPDAREALGAMQPDRLQKWAEPMDALLRLDKRDYDRALVVIQFATTNDFWQANILSPTKFRQKFDTLDKQAQRDAKQVKRQPPLVASASSPRYAAPDGLPMSWSTPTSSLPPVMPGARLARNTNGH